MPPLALSRLTSHRASFRLPSLAVVVLTTMLQKTRDKFFVERATLLKSLNCTSGLMVASLKFSLVVRGVLARAIIMLM